MKTHVTVIPDDSIIIVDGEVLHFAFAAPENLHALQWHNGAGHLELADGSNRSLADKDYVEEVAPFVAVWQAEKDRLQTENSSAESLRQGRMAEIQARMAIIEQKEQSRCLREISLGADAVGAEAYRYAQGKLVDLEAEIKTLREELNALAEPDA